MTDQQLGQIKQLINSLKYGQVVIKIQDNEIIQIKKTESIKPKKA